MQKEVTVLLVCLLVLFADILGFWQTIYLWSNRQISLDQFSSAAILIALGVLAALLTWINYILVRKIISR